MSTRGYALNVNTTYRTSFDLNSKNDSSYFVEAEYTQLNLTFYFNSSPAENLNKYTNYYGHSLVPPPWAFQPWNQLGMSQHPSGHAEVVVLAMRCCNRHWM